MGIEIIIGAVLYTVSGILLCYLANKPTVSDHTGWFSFIGMLVGFVVYVIGISFNT